MLSKAKIEIQQNKLHPRTFEEALRLARLNGKSEWEVVSFDQALQIAKVTSFDRLVPYGKIAVEPLVNAAREDVSTLGANRWSACNALSKITDTAAIPALTALASDEKAIIAEAAVTALDNMDSQLAQPAIRQFVLAQGVYNNPINCKTVNALAAKAHVGEYAHLLIGKTVEIVDDIRKNVAQVSWSRVKEDRKRAQQYIDCLCTFVRASGNPRGVQ